jgi:dipeptidyl aminopeptidase/acylaminoacyl peptidase
MRARTPALLLTILAVWTAPSASAQSFTVEDILSSPFPTSLVASPTGDRVAWVYNTEGIRNIWVADGPAFRGRPVTTYGDDDGQDIADLTFTPDGQSIVFVRGGAPNRAGEIPNPTSDPDGADREIWMVSVEGSAPTRLTEGSNATVSPNGHSVVFVRRGQIWSVPAAGGDAEQLLEIRGSASSLRWSPDGTHLAFVSGRGDQSFVCIFDIRDSTMRYLAPTVDQDGSPTWAPDGRQIAFIRTPHERRTLPFMPVRRGHPWSIVVADVESGTARTVWAADTGYGSVFQGVSAASQLWWSPGNRIAFPWERTGWIQLYSVPADGGTATALTTGAFEVEHVTTTPDGAELVFSSNQGDIDRRHVWRVGISGGPARTITAGNGIEWAPAVTAAGSVTLLASNARQPAHAARVEANGRIQPLAADAIPDRFPTDALVEPQAVVFPAADGMPIRGQLFLPTDRAARRPAVLFFHGGSRRQMLLGWHYMGYYHNSYALNQYLVSRGFVVLSVNYRSGVGYGLEFREAINYGATGASEFNDVLGAGLYLESRSDVDAERIGLWGGSYGGYLTAMGLARASDLFAAGVDVHGVHDWNVVIRNFVPSYNAEARDAFARLAFESSPMASIGTWRSPVLLIHGDDDRNVPFSESVDLAESLRDHGVEFEQLVFPDEVHGFLLHENWLAAFRASADFLMRKLGNGAATDSGGAR